MAHFAQRFGASLPARVRPGRIGLAVVVLA